MVGGVISLPFCQNILIEEYYRTADTFNPQHYHPQAWVHLAKSLGVQYVILTTKHHDCFALFHTQESDFSIANTPYKRDIVDEFATAMRAQGLRIGLYFSLSDWHHPDYPAFTEGDKPYCFDTLPQPTQQQWERYRQFICLKQKSFFAVPLQCIITPDNSIASGNNAIASGNNAIVSGNNAIASGNNLIVSSDNAIASGNNLIVSRNNAIVSGNNAIASGNNAIVSSDNA